MITVIYTIRDRNPDRIKQSVQSLKKNSSIDFDVIVVDYGSHCKKKIAQVCEDLSIQRIRCESEGLPWSKGHAINIGVRHAVTKYVVVTDIDMIFESDILRISLEKIDQKSFIHCRPLWLPKSGKKTKAWLGNFDQVGGYQFINRNAFDELNGVEEKIKYWGKEDHEWVIRLLENGYKQIWLDSNVKMYHQWHESDTGIFDARPHSATSDTWKIMISNIMENKREKISWGKNLTLKERPIIDKIANKKTEEVIIKDYINQLPEFLKNIQKNEFVCLYFGDRFMKNSSPAWITSIMHFIDKKVCQRWGFKVKKRINTQFDQWYVSLPYLQRVGLIDYFISKDARKVFLLFSTAKNSGQKIQQ